MYSSSTINRDKIKVMTVTGMMLAIMVVLWETPMGRIPMFGLLPDATIAILPSIVVVLALGIKPGLFLGAATGVYGMFLALRAPVGFNAFFINPLLSVFPRVMVPVMAILAFRLLLKFKVHKSISVIVACAVGSLTNTVLALGMAYLIYFQDVTDIAISLGYSNGMIFIWGIVATSGLGEVIVNSIIGSLVVLTLYKARLAKI